MQNGNGKRILVLGGTGAMGVYLVPELAAMGYKVDVVSLDAIHVIESKDGDITYIQANAKDDSSLSEWMRNKYDAIVDFMIYSTEEFSNRYKMMLANTGHYLYLSSYRVYAHSIPLKEDSARLLDVSEDRAFLATEDYSLYKAQQEDILRDSGLPNWTIVRPAVTYSKFRYQLVTLEVDTLLYRAHNNLPVLLPKEALSVQATMSWAGDVARMLSRLVLNPATFKEAYTVSSSEHHTWGEVAQFYKEIIGLEYIAVNTQTYLDLFGPAQVAGARYQLCYDRLFDRIIDNSKILQVSGLKQTDFMPLKAGLANELLKLQKNAVCNESRISQRMSEFLKIHG
ncbi:MAG: epimerase [Paenibacillaceae bacterium]|jgi:nucleoside-diphosphate-sugar epimerase|nr:epimerase [Paenibacillaceae bacterium]